MSAVDGTSSLLMWSETLNEFKSRLNAHFAISILLYDHKAKLDSREGLDARALHARAAGSSSAEYRGNYY